MGGAARAPERATLGSGGSECTGEIGGGGVAFTGPQSPRVSFDGSRHMAVKRGSSQLDDVNTPFADNWNFTQVNVVKLCYVWTINNFSFCHQEMGEAIVSSTFSASANDKIKWCLNLYPKGFDADSKDYVSLYLALVSRNKIYVRARYKISILNAKHEENTVMQSQRSLPFSCNLRSRWGCNKLIKSDFLLNKVNCLLPEDKLTISCEVAVVKDMIHTPGQSIVVHFNVTECRLSDDLGVMLDNEKFSDVTLAVDGRELQAHKVILTARSPVFAAIFEHDMQERKQNRVDIMDVDYEVLREMLTFIYTDRAPNLYKMAGHLLTAADKYALERLKEMCEESLYTNLSVETAADTLIVAHLHSSDQLKAKTIEFINRGHGKEVIDTAGWKNMISHPHLMAEVFRALTMQQQQITPIGLPPPAKRPKHA